MGQTLTGPLWQVGGILPPHSSLRDFSQSPGHGEEAEGAWPSTLQGECGLWLLKTGS